MIKNEIGIIGGAGFVGSRLVERLKKKNILFNIYDINITKRLERGIYLDVEDIDSLNQLKNVSTIINLAAVHRDDIRPLSRYDDVNVQGSKNICEAARKHEINKIISNIY